MLQNILFRRGRRPAALGVRALIGLVLVLGLLPLAQLHTARVAYAATPTDLFFSEYIEGSSNDKALEVYNGTAGAVNLAAGSYRIEFYYNGNTASTFGIDLSGTIAAGDVWVVTPTNASATLLAYADQSSGTGWFNGDDAVVLKKGGTILDVIGQVGFDPGSYWGSGLTTTQNHTLRRKSTVCTGDTDGSDVFDPSVEWDGYIIDTLDGLGAHTASCSGTPPTDTAPSVSTTTPANNATNVALDASITVGFSENVDVSGNWLSMSCAPSGKTYATSDLSATASGPMNWTFTHTTPFDYGDTCTVAVDASLVTDQDTNDPPDNMDANYGFSFATLATNPCTDDTGLTMIYDIQGSGAASPIVGSTITTRGIVTDDLQDVSTGFSGYFIQDATGDGNSATSDGVFVYNWSYAVDAGDLVVITAKVSEYNGLTELGTVTARQVCSTGNSVTPTTVNMPVPSGTDRADFWEPFEGMVITIPQELTVTETYYLGRYGELTLSTGGRLWQFTHANTPGAATYTAWETDNARRTITLDDGINKQNPDPIIYPDPRLEADNTLRSGATVTSLTGVLHYTANIFMIEPLATVPFMQNNPRTPTPPAPGGSVTVASFNLLNYFTTLDVGTKICGPVGGLDCRGANTSEELTRQTDKTVNALLALNADVVGMMELENNASTTIQYLVDSLNAVAGAGTYAFIDTGTIGGDAIKVALIYKPATVTPYGAHAVLDSVAPFSVNTRPPLAQTFEENASGELFTVVVNHFKSKGCGIEVAPDPNADLLDGQGCYNADRVLAANELTNWLSGDPTGGGDPDFLIIGDLNSYAQEDPITTLEGLGYTNVLYTFGGVSEYSYVFGGEWGYLDHALANTALTPQVAGATHWHINSDESGVLDYNLEFKTVAQQTYLYSTEPFRVSDHDPVLVGLNLGQNNPVSGGEPSISVFDPGVSKVGALPAGGIGLPGESLAWTITVTNNGTGAGSNVLITDTVRSEMRVDGADTPRGTFSISGQTVTFLIPWINPGETVTLHVYTTVITSPLAGSFTNDVTLSGTGADGTAVATSATGSVLSATSLPSTGYPPADDSPSSSLPLAGWVALIGVLGVALAGSGWLLSRRTR